MDKKLIKNFAIDARLKLRNGVINKLAKLGITESNIEEAIKIGNDIIEIPSSGERYSGKEVTNRVKLIESLKLREAQIDIKDKNRKAIAYDNLVEEVAYTWFNRLIALRFMEVNNYLPGRHRVLSSESGIREPDIITNLLSSELYAEMESSIQNRVVELLSDSSAHAVDELYQLVFIRQCNSLNQQLPDLFEKIDDYSELLFTISYIDENGVIASLLTIPEEDFDVSKEGQVEIIGWMYQYYNTEPKDKVFARGSRKIRADEIPAATQLFTPDWIVRYMVENSLGRYYIDQKMASSTETRTEKEIADEFGWKYYLPTAEQPVEVQLQIQDERKDKNVFALQELKLIDPSMGSGHILVYAFDVLIQLYVSEGFRDRDAVEFILTKNIYGLDIDKRAFQLAYFSLMMKGRQYSRRFLTKKLNPKVYAIPDNLGLNESELQLLQLAFPDNEKAHKDLLNLVESFTQGENLGSLIEFNYIDFDNLKTGLENSNDISIIENEISRLVQVGELLQQKHDIGVTNPPYLGGGGMNKELTLFVKNCYPNSKSDLFGVFIERLRKMTKTTGYYAMITQHAWMFLSSFEKLRTNINNQTIINMIHLGTRAFEEIGGEVVQTTAFIMSPRKTKNYIGSYLRLVDFDHHHLKKMKTIEAINVGETDYLYRTVQDNYIKIPGSPISYWVSEKMISNFNQTSLYDYSISPSQNITGNNSKYLRFFWEINNKLISDKNGWIFYAKGGGYRKWWGNLIDVINWTPEARHTYQFGDGKHASQIINKDHWYKKGITWGLITSSTPSFRVMPEGATFDKGGSTIIISDSLIYTYALGLLNSSVYRNLVALLNPTLNYQVKDVRSLPLQLKKTNEIEPIVNSNIEYSKKDWNSYETSWEFKSHPLI